MSTRRTTRSTKQSGPTLTDHFLQSRIGGSELPGKSLGDGDHPPTGSAKRTLFSSSRVQVIPDEVEVETLPVHTKKSETKSPARALFGAVPKKEVKKEVKEEVKPKEIVEEKVVIRSMIPTDADIVVPKETAVRKLRAIDLQEQLAKKGAAKIHEQINARKLNLIAEREAHLKSPQKMVQTRITEGSPPKRAKKESKKRGPVKVLPTPEFVLPTKSVEKSKGRPVRERSEEREASPQEVSLLSAPKGYGSSLMNDEVKKAKHIVLPAKYKELLEAFKSCEKMFSLLESSGKTITFSMLAKAVKTETRKEFSLDRFAQILAVYPNSYRVQVKKITCVGDRVGGVRSAQWEHVVRPVLDGDLTSFVTGPLISDQPLPTEPILTSSPRKNLFSPMKGRPITSSSGIRIPASPRKPASPIKPVQREAVMDSRPRLQGWRLACRLQVFRCLLARRVIAAHDEFINDLKLDPSLLPPSSSFLPMVFHEEFSRKMDSLCPPIEKAPMETIPEEENVGGSSHLGMGDFVKLASETVTLLPKAVEAALLELRSPEKKAFSSRGIPLSPAKFAEAPRQMSVLERIKAKKAAEAAAAMRRNPELEEKLADLRRLVDNKNLALIFDIYRSISRTSVDIAIMAERMADSKRIVKDMVPSLLTRLSSLAHEHFSINATSLGKFIRVSPDNSPATYTKVESILKKEMDVCLSQSTTGQSLRAP